MSHLMKLLTVLFLISSASSQPIQYQDDFERNDYMVYLLKKLINRKRSENYLPKDGELFEGDMVMGAHLRRAIEGTNSKRSAVKDSTYKWPGGSIPYELDKSLVPEVYAGILEAIDEYRKYTCVKFVPRENEEDYVIFRSIPHKCSSNVGRKGGKQFITLGSGCSRIGTILHEMMHVLGVVHEQSRPDRDQHIIVKKENIKGKYLHNFQKYTFEDVTNLDMPYNYASIMHYRNNAFSRNGEPTLIARNNPELRFGQRKMFSYGDIQQINRLYPCFKSKRYDEYKKKNRQFNPEEKDLTPIPNEFDTANNYF